MNVREDAPVIRRRPFVGRALLSTQLDLFMQSDEEKS
jgi:hypothetical protein